MTSAPSAEPLSSTQQFSRFLADWDRAVDEYLMHLLLPPINYVFALIEDFLNGLPFGIGKVISRLSKIWMMEVINTSNPYYYVDLLVSNLTRLQQRNSQLDPLADQQSYRKCMFYAGLVGDLVGIFVTVLYEAKFFSALFAILVVNWLKITNHKDRFIFGVIVLPSLNMGFLVAAISPFGSLGIRLLLFVCGCVCDSQTVIVVKGNLVQFASGWKREAFGVLG